MLRRPQLTRIRVIIPNDFWFLSHLQPCASGSRGSAGLGKARACDGKRLDHYDKVCWKHDNELDSVRSVARSDRDLHVLGDGDLYVVYPVVAGFGALFLAIGLRNFRGKVLP